MNLLHNAIKSAPRVQIGHPNQGLGLLYCVLPRNFTTEAAEPPFQPPSSSEPFLQSPESGVIYGRLFGNGITKHTFKTDVLNMLEDCNLSMDNIKIDYNKQYYPTGMIIQFPSRDDYTKAIRTVARKRQSYVLERVNGENWDLIQQYNGKYLLMQGFPPNALPDDVERFLSGSEYDASSMRIVARQTFPDNTRTAIVRFPSEASATSAMLTKSRSYCLNNQISLRVLH